MPAWVPPLLGLVALGHLFSGLRGRRCGVLALPPLPRAAVYVMAVALLVVLEVWLLLREYDRWSMIGMALAGAVLGYAALVRPFAAIDEWITHRPWDAIRACPQAIANIALPEIGSKLGSRHRAWCQ